MCVESTLWTAYALYTRAATRTTSRTLERGREIVNIVQYTESRFVVVHVYHLCAVSRAFFLGCLANRWRTAGEPRGSSHWIRLRFLVDRLA